jgi:formylmethanofuran dehydrogenase subunit E
MTPAPPGIDRPSPTCARQTWTRGCHAGFSPGRRAIVIGTDILTLQRLHDANKEAQAANLSANIANASMADLAQLVHRQQAVIRDLSVTVTVLAQMLVDAGVVNAQTFTQNVDAGIAAQREVSQRVKCGSCRNEVPIANTDIRADGPICDACVAKGL